MNWTTQLQTRSCWHPDDKRTEEERLSAHTDAIAIDHPNGTIYLTRQQAVQLATNLLTGYLKSISDVTYTNG